MPNSRLELVATLVPPLMLLTLALGIGCGQGEDLLGPPAGVLRVRTLSTGLDLDQDGYTLTVDQDNGRPMGTNDVLELSGIPTGDRVVALSGVADNCTVAGENPRTVSIFDQERSSVDFLIDCPQRVNLGTVVVATTTSGKAASPADYTVAVDPLPPLPAPLNGEVTIGDLQEGEHLLRLSGVPAACTVAGENPRTVIVPPADTVRISLAVTCWPPPSGRIAFDRQEDDFSVYVVRADGTGLVNLAQEYRNLGIFLGSLASPSWSPDGKRLAVWSQGIILLDAQPDANTLPPDPPLTSSSAECTRWSPDGRTILYLRSVNDVRTLFAVDIATRVERTLFAPSDGSTLNGCPDWSPDGAHIAIANGDIDRSTWDVLILDAGGTNPTPLLGGLRDRSIDDVAWGGDGSRVAIVAQRSASTTAHDIYVVNLPSRSPVSVTVGRFNDPRGPSLSPDGSRIVFESDFQLFVMNVDGSGLNRLTIPGVEAFDGSPAWGRDP